MPRAPKLAKKTAKSSVVVTIIPRPLTGFPLGRVDVESIETYHNTPAISHSKLMEFMAPWGRPSQFHDRFLAKKKRLTKKETEDMLIGNAADCLICEGEEAYQRRYAVLPYHLERPKTPVDWARLSRWKEENPGVIGLTAEQDRLNRRLYDAVMKTPRARAIVECSVPQITWRIALPDFLLQARTDLFCASVPAKLAELIPGLPEGVPLSTDLKTCGTLSPEGRASFHKNARDYDYAGQQVLYTEIQSAILQRSDLWFLFIAVEKERPNDCAVRNLDPEDLDLARQRIAAELQYLATCARSGVWPGADAGGVRTIAFPHWHREQQRQLAEATTLAAKALLPETATTTS